MSKKLFKDLLALITKPDVIAKCKYSLDFLKIYVADENNLLKLCKMHLGFSCESELINLKNVVDAKLLKEFRYDAQKFVIGVLEKMSGSCPLGYFVVRAAECFSPSSLSNEKMKVEDLQSKTKQLTLKLVSLKVLQYSVGDKALLQFTEFLSKEKVTNNDKFSTFNRKTQRLDDLYLDDIRFHEKYQELSTVMQIVFVLSHGQASVERGFNDNNFILRLNQNDDTVVARRFIKDHLKAHQVQLYTLGIDQKMVRSFKSAWSLEDVQYSLGKHQRE